MGHSKKLKIRFLGILKDKASVLGATLSIRRTRVSIVRATTHDPTNPPSDHRVASVLSVASSSACITALADRLRRTSDAAVAMKTLFLLHNIVSQASFTLTDHPSIFLNLSSFRDAAGPESWEMSSWVRWYGAVLDQNLAASKILGYPVALSEKCEREGKILRLTNSELLREMDAVVGFVEEISKTPDCLNMRKNNLVYEVVRLVGEDYRWCQVELWVRVSELGRRMASLSSDELREWRRGLERLDKCRDGLRLLFVNRNMNYRMWDLVGETLGVMIKEESDRVQLVVSH